MSTPVRIIGNYISPYVRKVLAVLNLKGIAYQIDPIVPFMGDERFSQISPLRRIPVLIDDRVTLCDSSVICQYLEDRYPVPSIYPADIAQRAQARWLEEYADTRMGDVIIWQLFNQLAINPYVWGKPTDEAVVQKTLQQDLPEILDFIEAQLPPSGFLFGTLTLADISLAAPFRNAGFVRFRPDAARWPKSAAWLELTLSQPCLAALKPYEDCSRKLPPLQQRAALAAMGAPLLAESYGTDRPRPGVMRT